MSLMWPTRISTNPTFVQQFARLVHWVGALVTIYFLFRMLKYLIDSHGSPQLADLGHWVFLAALSWFGGRGFRFIFGKE